MCLETWADCNLIDLDCAWVRFGSRGLQLRQGDTLSDARCLLLLTCTLQASSLPSFYDCGCLQVMTVRVAVTQKLRERIPSIAAVQLVN